MCCLSRLELIFCESGEETLPASSSQTCSSTPQTRHQKSRLGCDLGKGQTFYFLSVSANYPLFAFFFFFFLAFALLCLFNKSALGCARCVSALGLLWSPLVQTAHRVRNRVCVVRLSTEQSMSLVLCLRCSGSLYLCTCTSTLPSPVPPEAYVCALTAAASKL